MTAATAALFCLILLSGCHNDSFDFDEFVRPPTAMPDPPPAADPARTLAELNAYDSPRTLGADEIRAGEDNAFAPPGIEGLEYDDAGGATRVWVEHLQFAHLGIWINGAAADADFDFAHLNENVVAPPSPTSTAVMMNAGLGVGFASYDFEGEAVYNGIRFYPDGSFTMDFNNALMAGTLIADGDSDAADYFGPGASAGIGDRLVLNFAGEDGRMFGAITGDGFSGANLLHVDVAAGIFAGLAGKTGGSYSGRFHDSNAYLQGDNAAEFPAEVSGIFGGLMDDNGNELRGGFLGKLSP